MLHLAAWKGHPEVLHALLNTHNPEAEQHSGMAVAARDHSGNTPLHVAVRFSNVSVALALAQERPSLLAALNKRGETPLDLARSERMRGALRQPAAAAGACSSPLIETPGSEGALRSVGGEEQAWPEITLQVSRTVGEGICCAPGLASFVVSNGAGALGRHFCKGGGLGGGMPSIAEDASESFVLRDVEASVGDRAASRVESFASSSAQAQFASGPVAPLAAPAAGDAAAGERHVVAAAAPVAQHTAATGLKDAVLSIEDLEPISQQGAPWPWWGEELERWRQGGDVGLLFANSVPPEAELGIGTYGIVWRARSRRPGQEKNYFAVKNIRTRAGRFLPLAEREIEVANRIRLHPHPCLVGLFLVHHFFSARLSLYMLVMELCPGGDLLSRIQEARVQAAAQQRAYKAPAQALSWAAEVLLGLEHLHFQMDVLLRDLKPANVVISTRGLAKLTDFGFSRMGAESTGAWSFNGPPGSPGYIAPEALMQEAYDYRADLYSYGVLLWVLLSGGVLYDTNEPRPPLGPPGQAGGPMRHAWDWWHLRQAVLEPTAHGAVALEQEEKDLVLALTARKPLQRCDHSGVRKSPLIKPLGLPSAALGRDAVETWLDNHCSAAGS